MLTIKHVAKNGSERIWATFESVDYDGRSVKFATAKAQPNMIEVIELRDGRVFVMNSEGATVSRWVLS